MELRDSLCTLLLFLMYVVRWFTDIIIKRSHAGHSAAIFFMQHGIYMQLFSTVKFCLCCILTATYKGLNLRICKTHGILLAGAIDLVEGIES
jgi:uncharacterized membrane protein